MKKAFRICLVIALLVFLAAGGLLIRRLLLHEKYQNEQIDLLMQKEAEDEAKMEELQGEIRRLEKVISSLDDSQGIYQKLKNGRYVNILIVGDSIGAGTGASGSECQWFSLLTEWMHQTYGVEYTLTNISMGGNTSYAGYARTMILEDGIDYDLAIICYGENDSEEGFSSNYEAIIRGIREKYTACNMISILESSQKTYTNKMQEIKRLADYYGIPVADTIKAFQESGYQETELAEDGTHPGDAGQKLYFETLRDVILNQLAKDESFTKAKLSAVNQDAMEYESFRYYPVDCFVRTDEFTWEMETEPINGKIGVYRSYDAGNCTLKVLNNDVLLKETVVDWQYEFSQTYFEKISEEVYTIDGNIKLVFASAGQADEFEGLLFTGVQ